MKLLIGNKNYSSWSLRVWLTMKVKGIEFEEDLRPFDMDNDCRDFFEFAPHGKVPVLLDEGLTVYESLSILEYLAERHPTKGMWPVDERLRSHARCISHEMHAGFMGLRAACPMNMRRQVSALVTDSTVAKDIKRIEVIWSECLAASGGPFLFGEYCIADGMFAPIVNRLAIYELSVTEAVQKYTSAITALEPWQEWTAAARKEKWEIAIDEL